jgi:hypothetical protein
MDAQHAKFRAVTWLMAALLLAGGCSKRPHLASSAAVVIVPNVSIGPVHTGMTMDQVAAELGKPDLIKESAWQYFNLGFSIVPNKQGTVHFILCVKPSGKDGSFKKAFAGKTAEGIAIGATRAEVVRAYGEPTAADNNSRTPHSEFLRYKPLGLDFILQDGKVDSMAVILQPTKP